MVRVWGGGSRWMLAGAELVRRGRKLELRGRKLESGRARSGEDRGSGKPERHSLPGSYI